MTLRMRNLALLVAVALAATNPRVAHPGALDAHGCHYQKDLESYLCRTDAKALAPNPDKDPSAKKSLATLDECLTGGGGRFGS